MFRHSSKIRGLRSTNCSLENTSKLALFYVEENPCRSFSSWFHTALHFHLMNALVYVWKYPSYVYNLCTSSILAQCGDPKFCVVVIMLLSRLLVVLLSNVGMSSSWKIDKKLPWSEICQKSCGGGIFCWIWVFETLMSKKRN